MLLRLDKMLAEQNIGTRSVLKKIIMAGRVSVNGMVVKKTDMKIDTQKDSVCMDGREIRLEEFEYWILNKPAGCVCALRDKKYLTLMEYIPTQRKGLVPVGRLDLDTEGIILLTNDGGLNHRLLSPTKHVKKVYYAAIRGTLPADASMQIKNGVDMGEGEISKPAKLEILEKMERFGDSSDFEEQICSEDGLSYIKLTITEGKFHQVKRMCHALGTEVVYLKRIAFAGLCLENLNLSCGQARILNKEELDILVEG